MRTTHALLAEALTLLSTLAMAARAQTIEVIPAPEGLQWGGREGIAISPDGSRTAAIFSADPRHHSVLRTGQGVSQLDGPVVTSAMLNIRITGAGRVYATALPWSFGPRAGEWTSAGFTPLMADPTYLRALSPDGSLVMVQGWGNTSPGVLLREGAAIRTIPCVDPDRYTWFHAMNTDGSIVVGSSEEFRPTYYLPYLFRDGVPHRLPIAGRTGGTTSDVSEDGRTIAGAVWSGSRPDRAVFWFDEGEPVVIGPAGSIALLASRNGRLIAVDTSSTGRARHLWSPSGGLRSLADLGFGPEAATLTLDALSLDGRRAVGRVTQPEPAWARISLPDPCGLDYATDGFVDFFDYLAYVDCFLGDCPNYRSGDFNWDGFVDWIDYADLVDAFEAGC